MKCLAVLITGLMVVSAQAQLKPKPRFALSADHVAQAIAKALVQPGLAISSEQVSLLARVVASELDPELDVRSIAPFGGNLKTRSTVKLACHQPGICLPFYAIVSWSAGTSGQGVSVSHASTAVRVMQKVSAPIVMRAGANATLLMEDSRSHIQMSVISLENGPAGRTIRVQSADHKRTYMAEIVNANVLKGSF